MLIYKTKDQPPITKVNSPTKEVIEYLNQTIGSTFKATAKGNIQFVSGRLSEGYTVDDLKAVIDHKSKEWSDQPRMKMYLRPATLFAPTKFDGYLSEARMKPDNKLFDMLKDDWND